MITIYSSSGCMSCRKAKKFLDDNNLKYIERNILTDRLNKDELKYLLLNSDYGSDDIVSNRSKVITENKIDINSMSIDDLIDFIIKNPTCLKRPIIVDDKKIQIGYDSDEIERFLPKVRDLSLCDPNCHKFATCLNKREKK